MKFFTATVITLLYLSLFCCSTNRNLNMEDQEKIEILVNDIYQKAINNKIEYFKPIVGNQYNFDILFEFFSNEEIEEFCDSLRELHDKQELSDREILEFEKNIRKKDHVEFLRQVYNKYELSDEEILDWGLEEEAKSLMELIISARIENTYRKRIKIHENKEIINFDYHWDEKEIYFQIYIGKMKNGEWKLIELWKCR